MRFSGIPSGSKSIETLPSPPVMISILFTRVISFLTNQLAPFSLVVKQLWLLVIQINN